MKKEFPENVVNFVGITQIFAYDYRGSVLEAVRKARQDDMLGENIKTAEIESSSSNLNGESRNEAVLKAIKDLLGKTKIS